MDDPNQTRTVGRAVEPGRRRFAVVAATACLAVTCSSTLAQDRLTPPRPSGEVRENFLPRVLRYGVMFVLIGAVLTAAVFPSKRGHQD